MSERLTDDDLRDLLSQWRGEPPVFEVIEECLALRGRVAELEAALLVDGAKLLARNARLSIGQLTERVATFWTT